MGVPRILFVVPTRTLLSYLVVGCATPSSCLETDRRYLELVRQGHGSQLASVTPEELQASGDHEILNWIIALGVLGDIPAEIVDVRESHTQLAFRVAALWG